MTSTTPSSSSRLVQAAESLARAHHERYDPSHDFHHVTRVRRQALAIARSLSSDSSSSSSEAPVDLLVVELAAFFHDLVDKKYLPAGADPAAQGVLEPFWAQEDAEGELSEQQRRLVERVVDNVSYSKEVRRIKAGEQTEWHLTCRELHCVQDADKLDAIGAFGIMRCAAYSAITSRPLYLPPPTTSSSQPSPSSTPTGTPAPPASDDSAIAHFHDKLFHLEGMMKTPLGRELAKKRTETMRRFVEDCEREWKEGEL
ncbi:hypothetical protein JCM8097_009069 [Rhodosporidiobolus ruineniae]